MEIASFLVYSARIFGDAYDKVCGFAIDSARVAIRNARLVALNVTTCSAFCDSAKVSRDAYDKVCGSTIDSAWTVIRSALKLNWCRRLGLWRSFHV